MPKTTKKAFKDENDIPHLAIVKSEYDEAEMGIPADAYHTLDEFYGADVPLSFRKKLYTRLWDMGLREPNDFLQRDATEKYRQALRHAISSDSTDAIRFVLDKINK